jgi:hypothetical protein
MFSYQITPKKRRFILVNAIYLLLVASVIVIGNAGTPTIERVQGGEFSYSIEFGSSKNKIGSGTYSPPTTYSGTGTALTELGNSVSFNYDLLYNPTDIWQTIKTDGFITNSQAIRGMTSITLTKNSSAADFGVYWSDTTTFSIDRYELFDTSSPLTTICDFDGYLPNYIKIVAIADSSITSGLIEFSCVDNYPLIDGGTTQFGTYPQSEVVDPTLISTLNAAAGILPSSGNNQLWTDYGYYISGAVSSYMWYIDLISGTNEYRGVYFTSYRPYNTALSSSIDNSTQDDNGYDISSIYWFEHEPITWRVLDVQSGNAFLMANLVIDSQDYYFSSSARTISGATIYPNNYMYSHIRSWLNDNFYNTAFTTEEKARIQTTTVDNSKVSTGYDPNLYACMNTNDKVFLLSYVEATSEIYGLSATISKQLKSSAYAQSQGASTTAPIGNSFWWLRSPVNFISTSVRLVDDEGVISSNNYRLTNYGAIPSLWISL